eukprot:TRINITY_DN486_c0_g1_i4.p1 TRINITY_DN486_c0_g1~~TRINITY_DN486_c0_g1_i4.p1  ORF type:complete len:122 (+),score=18.52 TRINITY_DN486_c0_g1_i4:171-536(+)
MATPSRALSLSLALGRRMSLRWAVIRGGGGLPVATASPPSKPLDENEELIWDDGTVNPEPALDEVAPMIGKYEALGYTSMGLGVFGLLITAAWYNDKASKMPYVPKEYPFDNLRVELGGEP